MMKFITLKEVPTIVSILLFVASACIGTIYSSYSVVIVNAAEAELMTNLRAKTNNINHHLDYTSVYFNSRLGLIRRRLEEEQEEEEEEEEQQEEEEEEEEEQQEEEEEQENDAEDEAEEDEDDDEEENDDVAEEEGNDEEENKEEEEEGNDDDAAVDEEEEQEEGAEVAEDADADDEEEEEFDWTSYHSYENKYESMSQSNRIWSIVLVCWWMLLIVLTCIFCCEDGSKSSKKQASHKQPRYICSKCSRCDSDSSSSTQDSLKEALAVEEDFETVDHHENDDIVREEISEHQGIQKVCRYYYKKATDEIEF